MTKVSETGKTNSYNNDNCNVFKPVQVKAVNFITLDYFTVVNFTKIKSAVPKIFKNCAQ